MSLAELGIDLFFSFRQVRVKTLVYVTDLPFLYHVLLCLLDALRVLFDSHPDHAQVHESSDLLSPCCSLQVIKSMDRSTLTRYLDVCVSHHSQWR